MALGSSSRNGNRIIWIALHTAEGSRRRSDLYAFFDAVRSGSSHGGADGTGLDDGWVPDELAAWTLLNANPVSLNLEMCGFARWTREQWLSTGVVDGVVNPRQMVRNSAEWARRKCEKHNIPKSYIGVDGVRARRAGIITHRDYTYGAGDGDHTDIGSNFPWDVFFADMNGANLEDDMSWDEVLVHDPTKFSAPAKAFLTYTNAAVGEQGKTLDELRRVLVGNGTRPLIQQHVDFIVNTLGAQVAGLGAAVSKLAALVGQQDGADAAEIEAAVAKAIRENTLRVDIDVSGTDNDPTT